MSEERGKKAVKSECVTKGNVEGLWRSECVCRMRSTRRESPGERLMVQRYTAPHHTWTMLGPFLSPCLSPCLVAVTHVGRSSLGNCGPIAQTMRVRRLLCKPVLPSPFVPQLSAPTYTSSCYFLMLTSFFQMSLIALQKQAWPYSTTYISPLSLSPSHSLSAYYRRWCMETYGARQQYQESSGWVWEVGVRGSGEAAGAA